MKEVLESPASLATLVTVVAFFGFVPGFILRLIVRIYPRGHERRAELLGELYALGWTERPLFVAQQMETAIFEGMGARFRRRRDRASEPLPTMLRDLLAGPSWKDEGACVESDPAIFVSDIEGDPAAAIAICKACRVRRSCLDAALQNDERFGIWGGMTVTDRQRVLAQAGMHRRRSRPLPRRRYR